MNNYEAKQAARKARLLERAKKLREQSDAAYQRSHRYVENIPFGQPILVGHHSEGRHRSALSRSHRAMDESIKLDKKANYYERVATAQNHAISSDDEDAIEKLKIKVTQLEKNQLDMKQTNREYKKGGWDAVTGMDEVIKNELMHHMVKSPWGKQPFPAYSLTNNNANIRRLKQRIAELEAKAKTPAQADIVGHGFTVSEHPDDNRIWVTFDGKPSKAVCQVMRRHGFVFSPSRDNSWVRMLNQNGRWAVSRVITQLNEMQA
jgi:hypothetical protein